LGGRMSILPFWPENSGIIIFTHAQDRESYWKLKFITGHYKRGIKTLTGINQKKFLLFDERGSIQPHPQGKKSLGSNFWLEEGIFFQAA